MRVVPIIKEMGNLRKWGVEGRKRGGHEEREDVQHGTFDLLLSVASSVMHSQWITLI